MFLSLFEMFLHQSWRFPTRLHLCRPKIQTRRLQCGGRGLMGPRSWRSFCWEQSIRIQMEICNRSAMEKQRYEKEHRGRIAPNAPLKIRKHLKKNDQNYHEPQRSKPIHRSSCCFWGKWLGIASRRRVRYRQKLDFDVAVSAVVLYSNVASPPNLWYNEESWWSTKVTRVYPNLYHCMLCFKY